MENRITKFLVWCSGAYPEFLTKCPTEVSKYVGLGGVIFFTGVFAALSSGYALYTVFDNYLIAILLGLIWGVMIFNLDRYIISSMRKKREFFQEFLMAFPRIILAVIISIVISKPLELRIFQKEIGPELIVMEQQAYTQAEAQVKSRFSGKQEQLKNEMLLIEQRIETHREKRNELQRIAQEEADGTGGSKIKNLGPIYKIKKADADAAENELYRLIEVSQPRKSELERQLFLNDSLQLAELNSLQFAKRDGPAARIEALQHLMNDSPAIRWASWFILLLIIVIETAPVFVKLIAAKGPYDELLAVEEHLYSTTAIEETGKASAKVRNDVQQWPEPERSFGNDRLDATLKKL